MPSKGPDGDMTRVVLGSAARAECEAWARALAALGTPVRMAHDAFEVLQALSEGPAAALVLDADLPGISGPALCRVVHRRPEWRELPVVLLQPADGGATLDRSLASGAADVIARPAPPELVARRVALWTRLARREQQLERSRALLGTLRRLAGIATFELDLHSDKLHASEEVRELFGIPREEPVSIETMTARIDPEEREAVRNLFRMTAETGEGFSLETEITLPDESNRVVSWRGEVVGGSDGAPARITGSVQDITEQARADAQVRFLAYHDGLTGLYNRNAFMERLQGALESAREQRRSLAILFLDLDNFKRINDTLGHSTGDRLLQCVADRLDRCLRQGDSIGVSRPGRNPVSRLGGDEFTVLLGHVTSAADAARVARRILEALREPIVIDRHELVVGVSIGITLFPNDGDDVDTLLRNADVAMYEAKERGRNTFRFFSQAISDAESRRLALEERLRRAMEERRLELYYQPQVEIATGRLTGVEALLRWNDPDLGPISPVEFIPVAESSGLIIPIGEWVVREACSAAAGWRADGLPPFHVAVNISPHHFETEALLDVIGQVLFDTGFPPDSLVLEFTENVFTHEADAVASILRELKRIGVSIALDDFGTGYSSLSYLKRFPVDIVKIDRSFVRDVVLDPDDAAITEAMVSMARALRLRVVAEGVETEKQRAYLEGVGCPEMQGYLVSPPVPAADLVRLVRDMPASGHLPFKEDHR